MKRFKQITLLKSILSINFRNLSLRIVATSVITVLMLSSCSKNDEPNPVTPEENQAFSTSILLYAVASNNLATDFKLDMKEIKEGARNVDLEKADVWVYSLTNTDAPTLRHLEKIEDAYEFTVVKEYDRTAFSTDPNRISSVISDYVALSKADKRGLIMWSHATGWTPAFSDHLVAQVNEAPAVSGMVDVPMNYWYGMDQYNGKTDFCDLLDLDKAIPADTFDFIWFDCCYMSAIEVVYQLRDKTPYIIAYPTEVAAEGMPYQLTLPFLANADIDIVKAAEAMSGYFLDKDAVVTISITDTSALPALAAAAETAVTGERGLQSALQKYSRNPNGPFYDFGQYTRTWGESLGEAWDGERFRKALEATVIYKVASSRGFDGKPIKPENFSGLSCCFFEDYLTEESEYYKTLDWYKDVYTTMPE